MRVGILLVCQLMLPFLLSACASGGMGGTDVSGNAGGSTPYNEREAIEYKGAILRCHKTGGSRVVQIEGQLRCF